MDPQAPHIPSAEDKPSKGDALWRALSFLNWGLIFLALLGANWLCKTRAPLPEEGWQKRWVLIGAFLVLSCAVALMFAF